MFSIRNIQSLSKNISYHKKDKTNDETFFGQLRRKEFSRLEREGHVYFDYTGGCLYPASLVKAHHLFLQREVCGNPHSTNPASILSEHYIVEARQRVLDFFNAPDYYCIFTNNASGALQIVGESYPFDTFSVLLLTADNHNSVNGIREYCRKAGGSYNYSPINYEDLRINENELNKRLEKHPDKVNKLFAYPAQSNVSGVRHSLEWIEIAQRNGWDVLLDAAAFVPTAKLDLTIYKPDFVSLSFYKIFGYPTGIGCLLVKKEKFEKLVKPSYAGGTITLSSVGHSGYFLKSDHEKFENGTVNYLGIPAITNGLNFIESIGMDRIHQRIRSLSRDFISQMAMLQHDNDLPLINLYGPRDTQDRGGTFLLNFFDVRGEKYTFQQVEEMANKKMISFRTGCFCNPGIDELNNCISPEQLRSYFTSRKHGDYYDFIKFTNRMRGAVRVSLGIATTRADLDALMAFLRTFLNKPVCANKSTHFPAISFHHKFLRPFKLRMGSI